MKRKPYWLILALSTVCVASSGNAATSVTILADELQPQIAFAVQELQSALSARGYTVNHGSVSEVTTAGAGPRIVLGTSQDKVMSDALRGQNVTPSRSLKPEGFSLRQGSGARKETYWVVGADAAGAMYGGLELAEVIRCSG
ncbi:MAG: alpha-glucuronidase family glycosyl hydrolase, partial [Opitutus sp.]